MGARRQFTISILIAAGLCPALQGCRRAPPPAPPACQVAIGAPVYLTDGSADQGNGAPVPYKTPQTNANAGATQAASDPKSSLRVEGLGLAVRPQNAKNPKAITLSNTKATSPLTVKGNANCTLTVTLTTSTSIVHLIEGEGSMLPSVHVMVPGGRQLVGAQSAYSFKPSPKAGNLADIFKGNALFATVNNPGGNLAPDTTAPASAVVAPGVYDLIVEMTLTTSASLQADLVGAAEAKLQ